MQTVDYLIVGQGIAGSVLAWTLRQRGYSIRVIDDLRPSSSRVAAGICNPVTGRKLSKTWLADDLFPYLHQFYPALEQELQASFFYPIPVYRPYQSIEEQNFFIAQTANPVLEGYIRLAENNEAYAGLIHNALGGLETLQAAWVDLPTLLSAIRKILVQEDSLVETEFRWEEVVPGSDSVTWRTYEARQIISCEGAYGRFNPYFSWLPWAVVKGEILTLQLPEEAVPGIVNQSVWIQPQGAGLYRSGATYEWNDLTWDPSEKGRAYLTEKLNKLLQVPYQIQQQVAGIRPATQGRRPFMGLHPVYRSIGIFNGLGSKGTSMAPFLAKQFADFLVHTKELAPEANIQRFHSLYFSKINE
ncbi:FAD-dependent oxidoreductase [Siphonobacter sp. BAB-5405]|uniref:NAD(P)/FAD-dependent oxidoreductase n=1 Tax=Siphonobacter sp. BAB-5405 TaxID=1864825 RepID=UPI000C8006B4|nr:FAD-dependent oxidoreductase [Siphonobacter sp. BAB-5405]PMD94511.1 FAD-dependent oxidoreductase [Siphonobacter sp. BAB-5405]